MPDTLKDFLSKEKSLKGPESPALYTPSKFLNSKVSAFAAGPQSSLLHDSDGFSLKNNGSSWGMPSNESMQTFSGLASALTGLYSAIDQGKTAKLQREGLELNIKQKKIDDAFRAKVRANLSAPMAGSPLMLQNVNSPEQQTQPADNPAPAMLRRPING